MSPPLLIRADGGPAVGAGHLMRTLAIGQAWQERGGAVHFLIPEEAESFRGRLAVEGFAVHLTSQVGIAELTRTLGAKRALVDGYAIQEAVISELQDAGVRVLVVDDNGERKGTSANWVLNPNFHADQIEYGETKSTLLLGLGFTPLRREFRQAALQPGAPEGPLRVLVTLGGSDPDNTTSSILRTLELIAVHGGPKGPVDFRARVILGPAFSDHEAFNTVRESVTFPIETVESPQAMLSHYQWADVAISGAGSTTWELMSLRVPQCAVVIADNQAAAAESLLRHSAALVLLGEEVRRAPKSAAPTVLRLLTSFEPSYEGAFAKLDGQGALRVVDALLAAD